MLTPVPPLGPEAVPILWAQKATLLCPSSPPRVAGDVRFTAKSKRLPSPDTDMLAKAAVAC